MGGLWGGTHLLSPPPNKKTHPFPPPPGGQAGEEEEEDGPRQAAHAVQPALRQRGAHLWQEEGPQRQLLKAIKGGPAGKIGVSLGGGSSVRGWKASVFNPNPLDLAQDIVGGPGTSGRVFVCSPKGNKLTSSWQNLGVFEALGDLGALGVSFWGPKCHFFNPNLWFFGSELLEDLEPPEGSSYAVLKAVNGPHPGRIWVFLRF